MIDTSHMTQFPSRTVALIHLTVARSEIQSVMGPGIGEVMAAVQKHGHRPAPDPYECFWLDRSQVRSRRTGARNSTSR